MRVLLSLILLPVLALAAGIALVMGEREFSAPGQAAAVGSELTIQGRTYAPVEVVGGVAGQALLLEMPLDVSVNQIIRPADLGIRDLTTGQSGRRVLEIKVPDGMANVVLLVPLEGVSTAADVSVITQGTLDPGPLKDLGFGFFNADEMQRAAMVAVITLAALLVLWLPMSVSGSVLRRQRRKLHEEVEEERIRAARSQKEAKVAAARADERVAEIESNAHAREEEARDAIATAARAGANGDSDGEAAFWRSAVRDFLLAGNVARDDVERMLKAISDKVKDDKPEIAAVVPEPAAEPVAEPEAVTEPPAIAAEPAAKEEPAETAAGEEAKEGGSQVAADDSADDKPDTDPPVRKPGLLGRRRRRR